MEDCLVTAIIPAGMLMSIETSIAARASLKVAGVLVGISFRMDHKMIAVCISFGVW
ncbi:MAG: hypothetical protein PHC92_04350 [Syntrophomonadaceae bacterium]|nr:hypothetical protein [Syntrophomonadaceae bacterium]